MQKTTLDTGLLIKAIDQKSGYENILKICKWNLEGKINVYISSRLFNPDLIKMKRSQRDKIRKLLEKYNIEIKGTIFRTGVSVASGTDMVSGGATMRTEEEIKLFRSIVGGDPTELPKESVGKRLLNKIGDYDSLFEHYCQKRDVFLTFDKKDYLHIDKRKNYKDTLDLNILDPEDYIQNNNANNW